MEAKTIDDIFEHTSHYESRGNTIIVYHPVVKDMTESVLEEKLVFTAEDAEGTRYFGFFDPNIPDAKYFLASSKTSFHRSKFQEAEQDDAQEKRRGLSCRTARRQRTS